MIGGGLGSALQRRKRFGAGRGGSFSLSTRCAYFTSAATDTPASNSGGGGHGIRTSSSGSSGSSGGGGSSSHAATTLCLLDDPLTSLDAETRRHVLQHCFHGLMRRNPRVALVISCGELDKDDDDDEG